MADRIITANQADLTTLAHVNVPPAQTWNYLRTNDITFEVPTPHFVGDVYARLPQIFEQVECGIGPEAVTWITRAAGDARYIEVRAGEASKDPIYVDIDCADTQVHDTGVLVRSGAHATIVTCAHGQNGHTSASLLRVVAEQDARVTIIEIVAAGAGQQHLDAVGIEASNGARIEMRQYALGGEKVALGLCCNLAGTSSRFTLDTRYLAADTDVLDVNHVVRQRGRHTRADIVTTGILADSARKTMRETIDLIHGAKFAEGSEIETVLVTGDNVVNKTLPVILCDEEDVAGNHGASIGSISPEQLDFLASRGLSEEQAEQLFARALFDDATIHAGTAKARAAVLERASLVLGADVAQDIAEVLGFAAEEA
ncbi:MAG: SufD family Fe-S cluster assembly protein [Atopobiaceae bacterium]|nr:SufD family Fe-S cluster assembly protein [Atopobiaceae bacterium]